MSTADRRDPPPGGSFGESIARAMWDQLYERAVKELAAGRDSVTAMFGGNRFDMTITFRRYQKGELARLAKEQQKAGARPGTEERTKTSSDGGGGDGSRGGHRWWLDYLITMPGWTQWHYASLGQESVTRCGLRYTRHGLSSRDPEIAPMSIVCPTCAPQIGLGRPGVP